MHPFLCHMHWVNFIIAITSLPPSHQSLPPIRPSNFDSYPTPHQLGRGGGGWGKQQCIDFLGSSWNFPDFWNFDPPNSPGNPPPRSGVDQQFFLLVSGQFMTFPGLFISHGTPWGYADIPGEWERDDCKRCNLLHRTSLPETCKQP